MSAPFQIRNEIVEMGRRLYQREYIGAAEGNLSARLPGGKIVITPSGINKGFMKPDDLVVCDQAGKKIQGERKPSSEIKLHIAIYKWRVDITAICHAHPVYATAYSTARVALNRPILPEVLGTIGIVPLVRYGTPGTGDLPEAISRYVDRYDAFLLEAHGVVALGKTVEDAFNKIEIAERFARILFIAEQIGDVKDLSEQEIEKLLRSAGRANLKSEIDKASGAISELRAKSPDDKPGNAGYR